MGNRKLNPVEYAYKQYDKDYMEWLSLGYSNEPKLEDCMEEEKVREVPGYHRNWYKYLNTYNKRLNYGK